MLPDRWMTLLPAAEQVRLERSPARFRVVAGGRRSGKTERAKRRLIRCCLRPPLVGARYFAAAPTRDQAKRIFWEDLKALAPREWVSDVRESELEIRFRQGSTLVVVGLDRPQRIEGTPWDGGVVDEYAEVKASAWKSSIRPGLSTLGRPGWCWFTGRPKGRNHFYDLWRNAASLEGWAAFHWKSADVLPPDEIEAARRELDPLTFAQEYEADWVNFTGLAYHCWSPIRNLRQVDYDNRLPLVFCFDFNVQPGVAVVLQERQEGTCVIGQVHIRNSSNSTRVCRRLLKDWRHIHNGPVLIYGDATGGRRDTRSETNDWDVIRDYLTKGDVEERIQGWPDVRTRVGKSNPFERDRVNSMNTRLQNASGQVRLFVDPNKAPDVVRCFEGTVVLEGGSGEIDKKRTPDLTHWTDALGYYVHADFPVTGGGLKRV